MTNYQHEYSQLGYKTNDELSLWEKSYWYLRILVDTNRFGALGRNKRKTQNLYIELISTYKLLQNGEHGESEKMEILNNVLKQSLFDHVKKETKKNTSFVNLYAHLESFLKTPKDFFILAITIKEFLIPTNETIEQVPTIESTKFARKYGKAVLDIKKEKGLATIIRDWDNFTEALSLNKERDLIVKLFQTIRTNLKTELLEFKENLNQEELDIILSAICQEYERRVGQKRKQRAGNDLESATEFIFNYFSIKTAGGPEHFTSGLEVDNWIKDKDGWYIGVSLKRTLRERWKQTYTTETGLYDRYKIKNIIHLINNDLDLSDSKITELGSYRHLFFLADNSPILKKLQDHIAMGKYVFPMSELINKIKDLSANK